jgi:hypothetical protein
MLTDGQQTTDDGRKVIMVQYKGDLIIVLLKINLFWPWYGLKIADLASINTHSFISGIPNLTLLKCPSCYLAFIIILAFFLQKRVVLFWCVKFWPFSFLVCLFFLSVNSERKWKRSHFLKGEPLPKFFWRRYLQWRGLHLLFFFTEVIKFYELFPFDYLSNQTQWVNKNMHFKRNNSSHSCRTFSTVGNFL